MHLLPASPHGSDNQSGPCIDSEWQSSDFILVIKIDYNLDHACGAPALHLRVCSQDQIVSVQEPQE